MIIGIDPGVTGAICFINGKTVTLHKMPDTESEILDILFDAVTPAKFILEHVNSSPQMGVSTCWTFADNFAFLKGVIQASARIEERAAAASRVDPEISWELIRPAKWQAAVNARTGGDKKISLARAKVLFPDLKGLNLKTADAALIAYYGYMKYGN